MTDSHLVRFSQAIQALALVVAFVTGAAAVVPLVALVLTAAALGGPRWNLLAHLYGASPIPAGEPEPSAPPRFAQTLGGAFLWVATLGLFAPEANTMPWWLLGWGPALAVAVLAGLAASTSL